MLTHNCFGPYEKDRWDCRNCNNQVCKEKEVSHTMSNRDGVHAKLNKHQKFRNPTKVCPVCGGRLEKCQCGCNREKTKNYNLFCKNADTVILRG